MERATGKAERLLQIEALLLDHPEGLSQAEISRRTGVNRSTIHRYLPDLGRFCIYDTDDGRLAIDRDHYLTNVRLTLHESMALHLAARLMATRTDKQNPHAAAALRKLGLALEKLAPRVAEHLKASADVMDDAARRHDPVYLHVLETLTRAWSDGRVARLWHRMEDGRVFDYDFAPYFIEPYAVGQTTHVIGWREPPGALRTFKLERIQRIELTDKPYTIPADFDPRQLLAEAWGIWYTEEEPVEVVLKFHPRVAQRVRETRWHRSERVEDQPDGSLLWRAQVAEPQEMLPWVRGWGADVEVVEPEELREALVNETRRMALLYQVGNVTPPPLCQRLWAKTDKRSGKTHPLICHMLDVAQVTLALWREVLTESIRAQFADTLGLDEDSAGRVIAFWAGLHDLGKASAAFQRKYTPAKTMLEKELPFAPRVGDTPCHHGAITARTLPPLLAQETGLNETWAYNVAVAIGGHHGDWPTDLERYTASDERGIGCWDMVRRDMFLKLKAILDPPSVTLSSQMVEAENTFLTLLSGLTSVADWLGSMEDYFPLATEEVEVEAYARRAAQQARCALKETGWLGWQPPTAPIAFETLCAVSSPRPLQQAIVDLAPRLDRPALVIIEAPTGVGKTEAALYLADHWARALQQRGVYVAMPTMATSNQMFGRVRDMLVRRYPEQVVNYHLLHGDALLKDEDELPRLTKIEDDTQPGTVAALEWFTRRKRGLLAPFAVGTVDQALMSILQTRHFFVRLFGLSHKTVIFDEVHAYDTYMEELFFLLLRWLRAVGASVVVLSATLPEMTRRKLVEAYTGLTQVTLPETGYPAVTWTTGNQPQVINLEQPTPRTVRLERISRQPADIADRLQGELANGGCAAVICNTVGRAQEVYQAIRDAKIVSDDDLTLFHARFPTIWRNEIETKVLKLFGKPQENDQEKRPPKAIVVATQVIEQSLDLDFDLMISDLAPVDLIIQRMGRLHRHDRGPRPTPRLLLAMPDAPSGLPKFEDVWVYGEYALLRSWAVLRQRDCITIPNDIQQPQSLIEAVYGPENLLPPSLPAGFYEALNAAQEVMKDAHHEARREANSKLIRAPQTRGLLERSNACLEEDNPELHRYQQAATRLAPPSITLICLHRTARGLVLGPEPDSPLVNVDEEPDPPTTRELFNRKITVTDPRLVRHFADRPTPTGWRKNPWLRYARPAEFEGGVYAPQDETWTLKLGRTLGLVVQGETKAPGQDEL